MNVVEGSESVLEFLTKTSKVVFYEFFSCL